jgi:hypothetical protein
MPLRFVWPLFAALVGFALGGSYVWGLLAFSQEQPSKQPSHAEAQHKQEGNSQEGGLWDWITHDAAGFFTALLVIVGGVQLALFVWQLALIRESLDDAKIAADAAKESADAAKDAATALPRLERAYVFFSSVESADVSNFSPAYPVIIRYKYFNHGRTPAIIKAIQVDGRYIRTGFPEPLGSDGGRLPTDLIFGTGDKPNSNQVPVLIRAPDHLEATKGIGNIFFWARIDHEDVFGKPHVTAMCCEWHFGQDRFIVSGGKELNYHT